MKIYNHYCTIISNSIIKRNLISLLHCALGVVELQ